MKTHLTLLILSVCFSGIFNYSVSQTPSFAWAQGPKGSNSSNAQGVAYATATDLSGNVIIAGYFSDTVVFGSNVLASAGGHDIFLAKYNQYGNLIWANSVSGPGGWDEARALTTDEAGNIYMAGSCGFWSTDTTHFGNIAVLGKKVFLAKYDASGNAVWIKTNNCNNATGIAVDANDNVYLTGRLQGTTLFGQDVIESDTLLGSSYLARYDVNGILSWAKGYGVNSQSIPNIWSYGITTNVAGNVLMTGFVGTGLSGTHPGDTIKFGSQITFSLGVADVFIAKFDGSGNVLSVKVNGGTAYDAAYAITAGKDGSIYTTGQFGQLVAGAAAQFDSFTLTKSVSTFGDFFITKYDSIGNVQWAKQAFGGSTNNVVGRGIGVDDAGNVYTTGEFYVKTTFNGTDTLISQGGCNIFVNKYDHSGNLQWAKRAGSHSGAGDFPQSLAMDKAGNVIISGWVSDTSYYDNILLPPMGSSLAYNPFVGKIGTATISGIKDMTGEQQVFLNNYPNPFKNSTTIQYALEKEGCIELLVYNLAGQKIATVLNAKQNAGVYRETWNTSSLAEGLYVCVLTINGETAATQRMIVEK